MTLKLSVGFEEFIRMTQEEQSQVDFGYQQVPLEQKRHKVREVFDSVAPKYDVMNDLMSMGLHRVWKRIAVMMTAVQPGDRVLDCAAGTGDLTARLAKRVGPQGQVWMTDINNAMLSRGRARMLDRGLNQIHYAQADAEQLPFQEASFDAVIIGFGLRNVTEKNKALASMHRVLKPGGRCIVLEFSKPQPAWLRQGYDWYSFQVLPKLGQWVAGDASSYRYLAESIRMHPDQATLKDMMQSVGFQMCEVHNLLGGIVAIHRGIKP